MTHCDHEFVDSSICVKCGWGPPPPFPSAMDTLAPAGMRPVQIPVRDYKTFTTDDCIRVLANVGVDTTCGACMALAFTGSAIEPHTCSQTVKPELSSLAKLWLEKAELAARRRPSVGLDDKELLLCEAQVYRECAKQLKRAIGEKP